MSKANDTPDDDVRGQDSLVDLLRHNWARPSNDVVVSPMPGLTPLSVTMLMATIGTAMALVEEEDEEKDDFDFNFNGRPTTSTGDRKGSGKHRRPAQ